MALYGWAVSYSFYLKRVLCMCTRHYVSQHIGVDSAITAAHYKYAAGKLPVTCSGHAYSHGARHCGLQAEMLYAKELAKNELNHVRFLQKVLGPKTVPCPALNIGTAFAAAADAAFGTKLSPPFDPFRNDEWFALGAFIFEDVGVTAYNGAIALIKDPKVLAAAAGIASVEAYHAAVVRQLYYYITVAHITTVDAATLSLQVSEAVAKISALRAEVGGGKDNGFVPADVDSIAFPRNTTEVLSIVYLGDAKTPGGFFPEGLTEAAAAAAVAFCTQCFEQHVCTANGTHEPLADVTAVHSSVLYTVQYSVRAAAAAHIEISYHSGNTSPS
eukprot:20892-Heterococcus_DN1.PRE.2